MPFAVGTILGSDSMAPGCGTLHSSTFFGIMTSAIDSKDIQKWHKIKQQFKDLSLQTRKGLTLVVQDSKRAKTLHLCVSASHGLGAGKKRRLNKRECRNVL